MVFLYRLALHLCVRTSICESWSQSISRLTLHSSTAAGTGALRGVGNVPQGDEGWMRVQGWPRVNRGHNVFRQLQEPVDSQRRFREEKDPLVDFQKHFVRLLAELKQSRVRISAQTLKGVRRQQTGAEPS